MSDMLDAMQHLMSGGSSFFDPGFLRDLAQCWDSTHPNLTQANDNAWKGMMEFWQNDGYGADPWGGCCDDIWREDNATTQDFLGMLIYEPCNYASNFAYYHLATEVCHSAGAMHMSSDFSSAIIQSASFLAFGSSAFHGAVFICWFLLQLQENDFSFLVTVIKLRYHYQQLISPHRWSH